MTLRKNYDVIIVGAAICGATLVNILVDAGLSVLIIDKEKGVLEIPRAVHIDDEVLRYFNQFGMVSALQQSYEPKGPFDFFDFEGRKFLTFPKTEELDQGYLTGYYFHQPDFEHFLRTRATEKGATFLEEHEVFGFGQDADSVSVTFRDIRDADAVPVTARGKYMIACDGAASPTRKSLGITMEKLAESSRHIIIDFSIEDGVELPEDMGKRVWAKIGQGSTVIYVYMPHGLKRLEFDLLPGQTVEQAEHPDNVFKLIEPWVKRSDVKKIWRANVYTYHSLIADRWRDGRIFLAGDAAHLTPPFLGQGACTAVRDAFNLGWKLARVVAGVSEERLLDTYQTERRPHAKELVQRAGELGMMFNRMKNATPDQIRAVQAGQHTIERPILGAGLHGDAPAPAGALSPQPRLANGDLMDTLTGGRFAVVGDPAIIDGISDATRRRLSTLDAVIVEDAGKSMQDAVGPLGGRVMLVRPDRYLLGAANTAAEIDQIVQTAAAYVVGADSRKVALAGGAR